MGRDASTQHGYADAIVDRVAALLARRNTASRRQQLIGLSGLQGSGKSTLAAQLVQRLTLVGIPALALSLDDFYLGRRERARLARSVHPLLATRGVPGTHDLALLGRTLAALAAANTLQPARVPRFDKGRDTRMPSARWHSVSVPPCIVVLEGWCVGVPAQSSAALARPLNRLERIEDADAVWRGYVNAHLEREYALLWRRLDALVWLQAPGFAVVQRWRDEQEQALRRSGAPRAMSPAALRRFVMHYERLSRHSLRTLPARADLRIVLDARRGVRRIVVRGS
ncbi:MAG: kinase [Rudaea sp.]